jgi:hypothetical protein
MSENTRLIIALAIVTTLFAWSELLSMLPVFKANGVFQAVFNFLRSLKAVLVKKLLPDHPKNEEIP